LQRPFATDRAWIFFDKTTNKQLDNNMSSNADRKNLTFMAEDVDAEALADTLNVNNTVTRYVLLFTCTPACTPRCRDRVELALPSRRSATCVREGLLLAAHGKSLYAGDTCYPPSLALALFRAPVRGLGGGEREGGCARAGAFCGAGCQKAPVAGAAAEKPPNEAAGLAAPNAAGSPPSFRTSR
jgi:hypothetical protein